MRKIIHPNFEIDLAGLQVSDTEENSWFLDSFFTRYSFPFEIDVDENLDVATGFISYFNSTEIETYFEVLYQHHDKIEKAIFEVEAMEDRLSCVLRFGFEQLPSWDKRLSELSLDSFELEGETIYEHAETIIPQGWPAVNYNFPQIHIDKIDPENDENFADFEKIINNRKEGAFLENEVDLEAELTYNRNIMQPLPYLLHILQRGVADAGYTLGGKILQDEIIQKALVYADVEYYTSVEQQSIPLLLMSEDAVETGTIVCDGVYELQTSFAFSSNVYTSTLINPSFGFMRFFETITLVHPGKYRIIGKVKVRSNRMFSSTGFVLKYRDTVLKAFYVPRKRVINSLLWRVTYTVNVNVTFETLVDLDPHDITFESYQENFPDLIVSDLNINPIRLHDTSGEAIPTVINKNQVDLPRAVADMSFGDLVKVIKNWFNYDFDIVGNVVVMDPIEDNVNVDNTIDLSFSEVRRPRRLFKQGASYLLKFQDVDTKDYVFLPIFQNRDGVRTSDFVTDEKTTTIEINALPLPLLQRNGAQTAHAFESNGSKVYLVAYDGLVDGNNWSRPTDDYLLPVVHEKYWFRWFNFRINSPGFVWNFLAHYLQIENLRAKQKIVAYDRVHIIKTINRTEVKEDLFEIEIETEAMS